MVTAAITSGLHRLPSYAGGRLTAASEYKKRLFSAIYCSDKIHSSLNGTPPLLHRKFCGVEPCLDLDPRTPYLKPDVIATALESLDGDGWNTQGSMYATTVLRAKLKLSVIREEILELALGINVVVSTDIVEYALCVLRRAPLIPIQRDALSLSAHVRIISSTTALLYGGLKH